MQLLRFPVAQPSKFHESRISYEASYLTPTSATYHVGLWVGIGASNKGAIPTSTTTHGSAALDINLKLMEELAFTTSATNMMLQILDYESYVLYYQSAFDGDKPPKSIREAGDTSTPGAATGNAAKPAAAAKPATTASSKVFAAHSNSIWKTKAILINEHTCWHRDTKDTKMGWCACCYFGDFTKGDMFLPDIGCRLTITGGDIILLRSSALVHFIDSWVGEGRYVVVYFTHGDCM